MKFLISGVCGFVGAPAGFRFHLCRAPLLAVFRGVEWALSLERTAACAEVADYALERPGWWEMTRR